MKKLLFIMTVLLLCYALNYDILAQQIVATTTYPTTMTEPGQSAVINTRNKAYTHVCWYFTIANINSSTGKWVYGDATNPQQSNPTSIDIEMPRIATGTLVWAQIANAAGAQTMSITLAAHEYIK